MDSQYSFDWYCITTRAIMVSDAARVASPVAKLTLIHIPLRRQVACSGKLHILNDMLQIFASRSTWFLSIAFD
jgi:hypothetical protein